MKSNLTKKKKGKERKSQTILRHSDLGRSSNAVAVHIVSAILITSRGNATAISGEFVLDTAYGVCL